MNSRKDNGLFSKVRAFADQLSRYPGFEHLFAMPNGKDLDDAVQREDWGIIDAYLDQGGSINGRFHTPGLRNASLIQLALLRGERNQVLGLMLRGARANAHDLPQNRQKQVGVFTDAVYRNKEWKNRLAGEAAMERKDAAGLHRFFNSNPHLCPYSCLTHSQLFLATNKYHDNFNIHGSHPLDFYGCDKESRVLQWMLKNHFKPREKLPDHWSFVNQWFEMDAEEKRLMASADEIRKGIINSNSALPSSSTNTSTLNSHRTGAKRRT